MIDDEGPLHIDLHRARVDDRAVDFRRVRAHADGPGARGPVPGFLGGSSTLRRIRRHHERIRVLKKASRQRASRFVGVDFIEVDTMPGHLIAEAGALLIDKGCLGSGPPRCLHPGIWRGEDPRLMLRTRN